MSTRSLIASITALFLATETAHPTYAEPINPTDILVLDGDTIRIHSKQPNVRLVGFNAPETRSAACQAEAELGAKATQRLREIVKSGNLDFSYVRCSCPNTAQSCNWGRDCGTLKSNSRDVAAILIGEGLAVLFVCGPTHCPQTPRPWCHE